jgi:hypothetical protein
MLNTIIIWDILWQVPLSNQVTDFSLCY